MTEPDALPTQTENDPKADEPAAAPVQVKEEVRQGRRFSVASMRGNARGRVRYIEGNHPPGGCRFLG